MHSSPSAVDEVVEQRQDHGPKTSTMMTPTRYNSTKPANFIDRDIR